MNNVEENDGQKERKDKNFKEEEEEKNNITKASGKEKKSQDVAVVR